MVRNIVPTGYVFTNGSFGKVTGQDARVSGRLAVACATDGTKLLVKSVCDIAPKSLFWVSTFVPGFKYSGTSLIR